MTQITVSLSEDVAAQAQEAGLLAPERLEELLQEELRRRAAGRFIEMSNRMTVAAAEIGLAPMTPEEVAEEIHAMRAERRAEAEKLCG